jgi:adenylate kinase
MKDIVLMGIQWSGKWVQGGLLLEKYTDEFVCFEAWKILRALQSNDNPIGNYIGSIIDKGGLTPDEFMVKVFDLFLYAVEQNKPLLVDGFPRKIPQMEWFLERMKWYKREFVAIVFDLNEDIAIERIQNRRMCKDCGATLSMKLHDCSTCPHCGSTNIYQRTDDKELSSIQKRIDLYNEVTRPVVAYFETLWVVKHINANQSIETIATEILAIIQ